MVRLEDLFLGLVSYVRELWRHDARAFNESIRPFLYEPHEVEYIKKLEPFEEFSRSLESHIIPNVKMFPAFQFRKEDILTGTILDYLYVAATGNRRDRLRGVDLMFQEDAVSEALHLLVEDSRMDHMPNRVFTWVHNLALQVPVLEVTESVRFRRATRYEIRMMKEDPVLDWTLPPDAVPYPKYSALWHAKSIPNLFFVEIALDELSDSDIQSKDEDVPVVHDLLQVSAEHIDVGVPLSDEYVQRCRDLVRDAVLCIRLVTGNLAGASRNFFIVHNKPDLSISLRPNRPEVVYIPTLPVFLDGSRSGMEVPHGTFTPDSDEISHLSETWKAYRELIGQVKKKRFCDDLARAAVRYNQSFAEPYTEDLVIDLAVSTEILCKSPGDKADYRVAMAVSSRSSLTENQRCVVDFFKLRDAAVHGDKLGRKDVITVKRMMTIVRAFIRNSIFVLSKGTIPSDKHGFRNLLDACVVSCEGREGLTALIPEWSLEDLARQPAHNETRKPSDDESSI